MKTIKHLLSLFLLLGFLVALSAGCSSNPSTSSSPASTTPPEPSINYTATLNIYLPAEYVDKTVLRDFEKEFKVKVVLSEFDSNEDMYSDIKNSSKYDVVVPSDYMIDRLIEEGKLSKLDSSKIPNISYVAEEYLSPSYDAQNQYTIPYMTGTLGILYNRKQANISTWQDLFASSKIVMLDSERDTIGLTLMMLGYSMNSTNDSELSEAKIALQGIKNNIRAYEESEYIRDLIASEEAAVGVVYSGDGKLAVDENPYLAYVIPDEGSNKWTDGFVIMATSQQIQAAHDFINFMCRPNIAIRNMSAIGYTSPIKQSWSEFNGNSIMFPDTEVLDKCEAFEYNAGGDSKYNTLWKSIR